MEKIKNYLSQNKFEFLTFIVFCISTIVVSLYHEFWYDELQAYAIAKDNLLDIISVVPHYEGHSPIWYFILKFFQSFSSNPDVVLKIPNLLFMFLAVGLIVFKSPFPKVIRCILPFTYFFMYQYSVICRPYSLLILAFFAAAALYKERNNHPFLYITFLGILATTCIYGMVFCAVICIEWALYILFEENNSLKTFFLKDKRFFCMLIMFFLCVGLTIMVYPADDCIYGIRFFNLEKWQKYFYYLLGLPADATAFNIYNYSTQTAHNIISAYCVSGFIFGSYLICELCKIFYKNKKLKLFLITYIPTVIALYILPNSPHHIGLLTIALIYIFWCLIIENPKAQFTMLFKIFLVATLGVQLYWSASAIQMDVDEFYGMSKEAVQFIKENNLTNYKIMSSQESRLPDAQWFAVELNSYFNKNITSYFNLDNPKKLYFLRKRIDRAQQDIIYDKWLQTGKPDILISKRHHLKNRYLNDKMEISEMKPVKEIKAGWIYKDIRTSVNVYIMVRPELEDKIKK